MFSSVISVDSSRHTILLISDSFNGQPCRAIRGSPVILVLRIRRGARQKTRRKAERHLQGSFSWPHRHDESLGPVIQRFELRHMGFLIVGWGVVDEAPPPR